jgi:hypothetical protein
MRENRQLEEGIDSTKPDDGFVRYYKFLSLAFCVVFLIVGLIFLLFSGKVLVLFNTLSRHAGMISSPVEGVDLYLALAVAYMYLVSLTAFLMYRHPFNPYFPLLLANGKTASSLLSLLLFAAQRPYLIFLVNFMIDGLIGITVWVLYAKLKRSLQ